MATTDIPSPGSSVRPPLHVRFGMFTLDARQRRLERDGVNVEVAPKQFDALHLLIENAGNLVSKEVFHARLWPTTVVLGNQPEQVHLATSPYPRRER